MSHTLFQSRLVPPETIYKLENQIAQLEQEELNLQRQGHYVNAELTRQKLNQTLDELEKKKLEMLAEKHHFELHQLQKKYEADLDVCHRQWRQKFKNFNEELNHAQKQHRQRHHQDQREMRRNLETTLPTFKQSIQLLNLRKMEEQMAKQKQYVQATHVQNKIELLEAGEKRHWQQTRQLRIQTNLNQLKQKQQAELVTWRKKMQDAQDKMKKNQHLQEQALLQRLNNQKKEVSARYERQRLHELGSLKTKAKTSQPDKSRY